MKPAGAGGQRPTPKLAIVVLSDGQHWAILGTGLRNRRHAVVGAGGQVHDHAVDIGQDALERRRRSHWHGGGAGAAHQLGQPGGPDQIVGQDGDPQRQLNVSAR